MRFTYCPHCGTKLISKEIGDEGMIPFCENCNIPLWDMFTTSIIAAVVNEYNEIALLRQNYVSATKYVCVAGIMKIGESAEDTVIREVQEEIGQKVEKLYFALLSICVVISIVSITALICRAAKKKTITCILLYGV